MSTNKNGKNKSLTQISIIMKSFIFILSAAMFMALSVNSFAGDRDPKRPVGNNDKLKTTVRCGSERPPKSKTYTKVNIKKGTFAKKHYKHVRKHR